MEYKNYFLVFLLVKITFINADSKWESYGKVLGLEEKIVRTCLALEKEKKFVNETEKKACEVAYHGFLSTLIRYYDYLEEAK